MDELARSAVMLLIIFVAFSMIIGGPRGARWAVRMIISPVTSYAERRIARAMAVLVGIIVFHYFRLKLIVH